MYYSVIAHLWFSCPDKVVSFSLHLIRVVAATMPSYTALKCVGVSGSDRDRSVQCMQVDIEKNVLTLKVDHEENTQESHSAPPQQADAADASAPVTWHRTERSRMFVKRSVVLPESADTATAHASYVDGVLAITFPRKPVVDSATKLVIN